MQIANQMARMYMAAFTYSVESCTSRSESVASVTFPERLQPRNDLENQRNKFCLVHAGIQPFTMMVQG